MPAGNVFKPLMEHDIVARATNKCYQRGLKYNIVYTNALLIDH